MKFFVIVLVSLFFQIRYTRGQGSERKSLTTVHDQEVITTQSHLPGLHIGMLHNKTTLHSLDYPVLFLHGSSFPSSLASGFVMGGLSWTGQLAANGYDVYALDFLGYGHSDRYPEMLQPSGNNKPVGRAVDVVLDVDKAVAFILKRTGKDKVYLIGHSWGGSVAALYATMFPEKIAKLVLFAPMIERPDTTAGDTIRGAWFSMTPAQRIEGMKEMVPAGKDNPEEPEIRTAWGKQWLRSDPLSASSKSQLDVDSVRIPSGPNQDIEDMLHHRSWYNPEGIKAPTLVIRGEWDDYPSATDAQSLLGAMLNVPYKKSVTIGRGTHVMHLEKSRIYLYDEVLQFLRFNR